MKLLGCCLGLGVGLATLACSGRYDVGFEPTGGAAGTSNHNNTAGTEAVAMGGSASAGSGSAGSGAVSEAGTGSPPVNPPRCDYGTTSVAAPSELASSEVLAARVYRFLEASDAPSDLSLPATPSAAWVARLATSLLDEHAANETAAPGLVRFLADWLPPQPQTTHFDAADVWGEKLVAPDASLATLLSDPTGAPHHFGILTEPAVLVVRSGIAARGAWFSEALFCSPPPPPPASLPPFEPAAPPGKTFRQHYEESLSSPACSACHNLFDPPGASLEHYDAQGNYRELDNGLPVDASGVIVQDNLSFDDFESLAPQLAQSCVVGGCVSRSLLTDALDAGLAPQQVTFSEAEGNRVATAFFASDFSIRALVKAIVTSPSFLR